MFRSIHEEKLYVICPGGLVTGGSELLHQLVGYLASSGRNASIVYSPIGRACETPEQFRRYGCPVATRIENHPAVAVIVPEVSTKELFAFPLARHVVWWLSVDNYAGGFESRERIFHYLRRRLQPCIPPRTTHLFQCAYAREFVAKRFGADGAMLTDYLADEYLANGFVSAGRSNTVTFNPKKGLAYTSKLIQTFPDVHFRALEGMSRTELRAALDSCKVYIDLGEHPGKDRLPREAASRGAVVIVAKRGSASNREDVPLPDFYKLPHRFSSIYYVRDLIEQIFSNFSWHQSQQISYRTSIQNERTVFETQAAHVFCIQKYGEVI